VIVTGAQKGDYIQVTNGAGTVGWIKIILVAKR
jgi:hypothetical protein